MPTSKSLIVAAIGEAATGVALIAAPALVIQGLLGAEASGIALLIARIAGVALLGLAIACWPGPPVAGMVFYGVMVTISLGYFAIAGIFHSALLWPAAIVHLVLTLFLAADLRHALRNRSR